LKVFKVDYKDNKPVYSVNIPEANCESVKMELRSGHCYIKWLVIYAKDEDESVYFAGKFIKTYFDSLLSKY
jgi:hypothetical protein